MPAAQGASTYKIVNVDTLGGAESAARGLNDAGLVVGESTTAAGDKHAFSAASGEIRDLGTLGGSYSSAAAVNAAGVIVGESTTASGETHAFAYSDGAMRDLGTLGGSYSSATAINSAGAIVGESTDSTGLRRAFLYSNGVMSDLGTLGGSQSIAYGINDAGQVVGWSQLPNSFTTHAFLWSNGAMMDLNLSGEAAAIDGAGRVVGTMLAGSTKHAFLRSDGGIVDLGSLELASYAKAINDAGEIVGYSTNAEGSASYAFLYSGGAMRDLNKAIAADAGWLVLRRASAINREGQIAGTGVRPLGPRGFIMSPLPDATIGEKPAGATRSTSARFTFSATETSVYTCKLDDNLEARCDNGAIYEGLADGSHTFAVRATGRFGMGPATTYAWTVDTVAPSVTIGSGPADPTSATSASVTFSSEAGARFECSLDGGAFASCSSPVAVGPLVDGRHTLAVRATDAVGNVGSPATHSWTVDTVAPVAVITQGPNQRSAASSVEFLVASEPGARFECALDSLEFVPCTTPARYSNLVSAVHRFTTRAVDAAGNAGPPASYLFAVKK